MIMEVTAETDEASEVAAPLQNRFMNSVSSKTQATSSAVSDVHSSSSPIRDQDEVCCDGDFEKLMLSLGVDQERALTEMLTRVAQSDAHFMHQQRGEPDLTFKEKTDIAKTVYDKNPVTFLSRFGKYLVETDLKVFDPIKNEYEVGYYLSEIRKRLNNKTNSMKIRNRRFEAMKKMTSEGLYFDEESMKSRDPLLYEQMVGQYLTEEQVHSQVENKDLGFASVLLQHVQSLQDNQLYNQLKDIEEGQHEEESEEEEVDMIEEESEDRISALDQQMLRNEFLRTMQLRFLNGEDAEHFDYREVDENVEYDSLDIREHDEEEKYFDSDEELLRDDAPTELCDSSTNETVYRVPQNGHPCTDISADELDYETYEVKEDVRPGLLESFNSAGKSDDVENVSKRMQDTQIENG